MEYQSSKAPLNNSNNDEIDLTSLYRLFIRNKRVLIQSMKNKSIIIKIFTSSFVGTFMALTCWILGQTYIQKLALASIIGQTSLIFIMFLSWFFLKEKITLTRIVASIFALFGVFLSNYF